MGIFAQADPSFVAKLEELKRDPKAVSKHMSDQRVIQCMGMLMGVNMQTPDSMGAGAPPPKKKEPEPEPEPELTPEQQVAHPRARYPLTPEEL